MLPFSIVLGVIVFIIIRYDLYAGVISSLIVYSILASWGFKL
jgi:hypothetical protein